MTHRHIIIWLVTINNSESNRNLNNFAIDTAGISEAIERSGASLKAAGNDLNESLGMIVAANNSLQNPSTVGQMLKTISMRLRGATASELSELGIDTEGMSQGIKSVVKQFKAMANIDIMQGTDYKSTFRILDELHNKWLDLTDAERAALTEAVAGKRGGSVMASLMENWEDARDAVQKAADSFGSAAEEQKAWEESLQYSIDVAKASLQELANDFLASSFLKSGIDILTKIINLTDKLTDSFGSLGLVVIALGARWSILNFDKIPKILSKIPSSLDKLSQIGMAMNEFKNVTDINGYANAIKGLTKEQAMAALSTTKLSDAQKNLILSEAGVISSSKKVSVTKAKELIANSGLAEAKKKEAIDSLEVVAANSAEAKSSESVTAAQLKEAMAKAKLSEETQKEILSSFEEEKRSLDSLKNSAKGLGASIKNFITNPLVILGGVIAGSIYINNRLSNSQKELAETAKQVATSYKSEIQQINSYEDEIIDLKEKLDSGTLSYDESVAARERLVELSNILFDTYGKEINYFDLLTGSVNDAAEAFDNLRNSKANEARQSYDHPDDYNFFDWWNDRNNYTGYEPKKEDGSFDTSRTAVLRANLAHSFKSLSVGLLNNETEKEIENALSDLIDSGKAKISRNLLGQMNVAFSDVSAQELKDRLVEIQDIVNNSGLHPVGIFNITNAIKDLNKWLEQTDYNTQQLVNDALKDEKLNPIYNGIQNEISNYENALTHENDVAADSSLEKILQFKKQLSDLVDSGYIEQDVSDALTEGLAPLEKALNKKQLKLDIEADVKFGENGRTYNDLKKSIQAAFNSGEEIKVYTKGMGDQLQDEVFDEIETFKQEYGMTIDEFVDFLEDENVLLSQTDIDWQSKLLEAFNPDTSELQTAINNTIGDYELLLQEALEKDPDFDLSKSVYGNVDLLKRGTIDWTDSALEQYKSVLESWYGTASQDWEKFKNEMEGSYSTVMGSMSEINGIPIAYTPMLQTDNGLELLSADTMQKYFQFLENSLPDEWHNEDLLALDAEGFEIDGKRIKNMIADIGETAENTSIDMHYHDALMYMDQDIQNMKKDVEDSSSIYQQLSDSYTQISHNQWQTISQNWDLFIQMVTNAGDASIETITRIINEIDRLNAAQTAIKIDKLFNFEGVEEKERQVITNIKNDLIGLAQTGKLDADTLKSYEDFNTLLELLGKGANATEEDLEAMVATINSLATQNPVDYLNNYATKINELSDAYETLRKGGDLTISQLSELQTAFGDLASYQQLEQDVLNNTGDLMEDLNNIVTEITGSMSGLTDKNREFYESVLQDQGVTNAHVLTLEALKNAGYELTTAEQAELDAAQALRNEEIELEKAQAAEWLAKQDLNNITPERIQQLMDEGTEAGISKLAIADLMLAEVALNNTKLDLSQQISEIERIGLAAGLSAKLVASVMGGGGSGGDPYAHGGNYDYVGNKARQMYDAIADSQKKLKAQYDATTASAKRNAGATKGAGNAAKDAAKDTKEATNELQKLSSELDDIQSAWKKLDDIQKSYAETGKITVDQAQELINTDYRYLAMLNMEGDAMTVNQAAFETLTEAKLNEMKITLIRNAIDLVNTFQDEAVAAEYVANSYLNMGSAAAQATAQVQALQAAVAGLQASGSATQAQAAGLVMQGTMNALSMLNHVDMSTGLGSNAATSATSGSDPEDAAEEVEEAIEEQTEEVKNMFNWIDRLLERLSRRTEKWMNKAERFFSWWKKNEMVNKAIKSGRGEIKQTNRAYSYYLAQAQAYDLDPKYKKKVEKGEVWIDNITDDDLADKIRDYQELWEQIEKCKDSLNELYDRERELIYQKLDNIVEYFDNIQNYYETMAAKFESRLSVDEAWGNKISFTDLLKVYQMNAEAIRSFDEELFALQTGLSKETSRPSEEVFSDIENKNVSLEDTDLYSRINQNIKDLASDREYYDSLIARREELKKAIKEATDKASKKELQAELKELKKEIKANKPSKENQKAYKAQTNITEGFSTMLGTSDYYDTAVSERNRLLEQQTKYNELKKQIAEKKAQIAEAASKEEQQQLKNELKNLKKEAKDAKLNKKDQKTLKALESQVEATERIRDDALVDSEVASSAAYQELLKKIGKLQNKETLSPNQEKKLAMYLDELDAINQGVLVENLTGYMQVYERWWQLKNKENLSVGEWKELEHLETRKQAIEQKFRDEVDRLREEYEDSLMVEGKTPTDLQRNFEKEKKEIEDSYNKQIDNLENGYMNSPYYEDLISKINDTEEWIEDYESHSNKWRKNHGFTEEDYEKKLKKLDKLKSTEAALHEGATEQNIDNYIKDWKTVYKYQAAFDSGTLSNKNGERDAYMAAKKRIDNWNQNKQRDVQLLKDQLDEEVENLRKYYNEKIASAETSQNEKLAEQAGIAKQLVELEVSQIQAMIDNLDAVINRYQSIAHLLEQTSLDNIKKYNLMSLFGLEDNKSVTELITDQLTSAVASSESKISQSVTKINLLQELVDVADEGGFEGVFEKYLETASEENAKWINELIDELNSNVKSTGSWVADWNQQISETTDELINTVGNIQTLKDEFRENVMFKAVKNAIEQLDQLNSRLNSMASIIQDNWTTIDGNLTEFGLAKLNLLGQEIGNSQEQVKYWQEQIALIDEAWNNDMSKYGSEEEYIKAKNEAVTSYYSAIQGLGNLENQVYQLAKKAQEEEINRLKELTNSRLKALAAKKKLYEYDKSLKGKTKDVEALEAQIAALNGVSTAAAKAQRAQLEAQLAEAKQSREDLITEHTFELQTDALQALLDDLDKTLTDTAKSIKETFEEFADVVSNALAKAGSADVDSSLGKILSLYMGSGYTPVSATTGISESTRTVNDEPIYYESYKYTPVSQSDYLTSLNANALDANLYLSEWQNSLNNIYSLLDDKLSYLNNIQTNNSNNVNITLNYDNLINVTGSVDATVVKDLEKLSKDIVIQTKKSLADDLRKLGVARSY